jgi:hypothetical protein
VRLGDVFDAGGPGRSHGVSRVDSGDRARDAIKSTVVGLLLLSVVVTAIAGADAAFFGTVLAAWSFFPVLVGVRRTLDAGCAFMLISIGVLVVVELAQNGPGSLMP